MSGLYNWLAQTTAEDPRDQMARESLEDQHLLSRLGIPTLVSLNTPIIDEEGGEVELGELIVDEDASCFGRRDTLFERELAERLRCLPRPERRFLELSYGVGGEPVPRGPQAVRTALGLTAEAARSLEAVALRRLAAVLGVATCPDGRVLERIG